MVIVFYFHTTSLELVTICRPNNEKYWTNMNEKIYDIDPKYMA